MNNVAMYKWINTGNIKWKKSTQIKAGKILTVFL